MINAAVPNQDEIKLITTPIIFMQYGDPVHIKNKKDGKKTPKEVIVPKPMKLDIPTNTCNI
jgi:hypothetical protein